MAFYEVKVGSDIRFPSCRVRVFDIPDGRGSFQERRFALVFRDEETATEMSAAILAQAVREIANTLDRGGNPLPGLPEEVLGQREIP